jgi:kynurenine formamidase
MSELPPRFDDLPVKDGAPAGSSWGVWGDDDRLGCLNLLTPERIVEAARLVRKGSVFALNLELHLPDPPLFGRQAPKHEVLGTGGHDDVLTFNTQSSSQWDGFRHVRSHHGNYNGIADEDHGIHLWAERGIAGRAVLADVARWREAESRPVRQNTPDPITPDDIAGTLAAQGVELRAGDILLVRTGWLAWYRGLDADGRAAVAADLKAPGLAPGLDTARYLWDAHIAGIGVDNPAVELWPLGALLTDDDRAAIRQDPDRGPDFFVHLSLLPLLGLPLGELWDLDALAADCAADGSYEGLFTSAPLRVVGGVASPPNAIVLK